MRLSNWHYTALAWLLLMSTVGVVGGLFARGLKTGDCGSASGAIGFWLKYRSFLPHGPLDGEYHEGMLSGFSVYLSGDRYAGMEFFDAGPRCFVTWGDARQQGKSATLRVKNLHGMPGTRWQVYGFVRWHHAGYLVRREEMKEFTADINRYGMGFQLVRDLPAEQAGGDIPEVPDEYRGYLRSEPIVGKVIGLEPGPRGGVMVFDKGARDGLLPGMILFRTGPGYRGITKAEVISLSAAESKLKIHDYPFDEIQKPEIDWLWTTGEYDKPDRS